ncbi:MAG: hypothetical protein KDE51_06225, partial [Anaerolineales bacterium]|nr:hypothetical protein [Anaerolineales bacterium]
MGFSYFIVAGASCIISVDVTATGAGLLNNVSGELTASSGGPSVSSGKASDVLTVTVDELTLTKTFLDDPAIPGTTADLEFTITNRNRDESATNITFTDDLDATLSGLVAVGLPLSDVCGAGSTLTGSSLLTLTGGNLAAEASCTFTVTLQVPAGAAVGDYVNTTSTIAADVGGEPVIGSPATDTLFVDSVPILTKTFLTNPIGAGDSTSMEFTITNSSTTSAATNIAFTDNLTQFFSGILVTGLPAANYCGPGSFITIGAISGESYLVISGANLAAGASCTFTVDLLTPAGGAAGSYDNITSDITATIDGETKVGDPAEATLQLISSPFLTKRFVDDPVLPGETVQLEFTIANGQEGSTAATDIQFTDDLNGVVSGLTALGLPATDVCGAGSQIAGTTNLTFTGGSLAPAESCTFTVTLQVPANTLPGSYDNITSNTTATVSGYNTIGNAAGDTLEIAGLSFSKSFINDPVLPGGTAALEFTIINESPTNDATSISFVDNLNNVVSGLAATGLPLSDICGAGSQIIGTSSLTFVGGNLTAGSSCTFSVTLNVPAAAASNTYYNVTSNLTANVGGNNVSISPATDQLTISDQLLFLTKTFVDDPVPAGGTVNLSFTLSNLDPSETVTNITFTDDLDAALSGLTAVGLPANDVCGAGSQLSGTSLLTLTGGQLAPSTSCTFVVALQVPAAVPFGTTAINTTSQVTGLAGGLGVTGDPATDDLQVEFLIFEKRFAAPAAATGTAELIFSITNLDSNSVAGVSFLDDLNAMLPGATAVGLPLNDVCGAGSQLTGSSLISLSGGTLGADATCEFSMLVQIPAEAAPGQYLNSTGNLALSGLEAANPATATLTIEPPPLLNKSFIPDSMGVGQTSELTLVIDNRNSALPANGLNVTDNLPAGMVVAQPPNSTTTCFGGTLTAVAGTGTISYTGGGVPAGDICIIQVDVTANNAGIFVNVTGELTSSSGSSGTAMATLTVNNQPTFAKSFTPDELDIDEIATLLFTIDNSSSTVNALDLSFTDNLPTGLTIAPTPNASTTCTGGTITAVSGTDTLSYAGGSVAAGSSCTLMVDVASSVVGDFVNVTEPLLSSLGSSGTATATITFNPLPTIAVAKTAAPSAMPAPGGNVSFTVQVTNTSPIEAVDLISLMDDVYGGLQGQGDCVLPQTIASGMAYICQFTGAVSGTAGQVFTDTVAAIAQDSDGNQAMGQASASVSLFDGTIYLPM